MSWESFEFSIDAEKFPTSKDAYNEAWDYIFDNYIQRYPPIDDVSEFISNSFHGSSRFEDKVFENETEACMYLSDKYDVQDGACACKYKTVDNYVPTETENKINKRIKELREEQYKYQETHAIRNYAKTARKHCTGCGSEINIKYFRTDCCPLCGTDLQSGTVKNTLQRYNERIESFTQKLHSIREKRSKKMKPHIHWLIKVDVYMGQSL